MAHGLPEGSPGRNAPPFWRYRGISTCPYDGRQALSRRSPTPSPGPGGFGRKALPADPFHTFTGSRIVSNDMIYGTVRPDEVPDHRVHMDFGNMPVAGIAAELGGQNNKGVFMAQSMMASPALSSPSDHGFQARMYWPFRLKRATR